MMKNNDEKDIKEIKKKIKVMSNQIEILNEIFKRQQNLIENLNIQIATMREIYTESIPE